MCEPKKMLLAGGVLITMDAGRRVLEGHALVLDAGRIADIGPEAAMKAAHPDAEILDCGGCVVLPGFIDCGGWAGVRPFGGLMQSFPRQRLKKIKKTWVEDTDEGWWRAEGQLMAASRLLGGVTLGAVHYLPNAAPMAAAHDEGYSKAGGCAVAHLPAGPVLDAWQGKGPAPRVYMPALIPSHPGRITDDFAGMTGADRRSLEAALEKVAKQGLGFTAGAWGKNLLAVQAMGFSFEGLDVVLEFCGDMLYEEMLQMKSMGMRMAHLPMPTVRYAPFAELLEQGVCCAVMAEDVLGAASDMLQSVRRAQMVAQLRFDDLYYLPVGRQLELITIDAARVLGLDAQTGSLEMGKQADVVVVDMQQPRTVPWRDMPVHRLMIDANVRQVRDVFSRGRHAVRDGRHFMHDVLAEQAEVVGQALPKVGPWPWGRAVAPMPNMQEEGAYNG